MLRAHAKRVAHKQAGLVLKANMDGVGAVAGGGGEISGLLGWFLIIANGGTLVIGSIAVCVCFFSVCVCVRACAHSQ